MVLLTPTCLLSKLALLTVPKDTVGAKLAVSSFKPLTVAVLVPSYSLLSPNPNTQAFAFKVPPPVKFAAYDKIWLLVVA
ncbi:hypothetical protein MCEMAEM4_03331 [Burkholderiaceae bacterium]